MPPAEPTIRAFAGGHEVPLQRTASPDGSVCLSARADSGPLSLVVDLEPDERVVGFGEQFVDIAQRGRVIDGWIESLLNADPRSTYHLAPLWHSSRGYTLHVDTTLRWSADVGASDPTRIVFTLPADELTAYLHVAPPRETVAALTKRTGLPPALADWGLGVWGAARSGTKAVLAEAERFLEAGIPLDAVWVDDHYDEATNSGDGISHPFPAGDYGPSRELTEGLHELGLRALTYINCAVYRDTAWWHELTGKGLCVRTKDGSPYVMRWFHPLHQDGSGVEDFGIVFEPEAAGVIDLEQEAGRRWWRDNVQALVADGWDGWMQDFGEQHPGAEEHNRYPLHYHRATREALDAMGSEAVFWVRSGYLGSQAFPSLTWGGDQGCDWSPDRGLASLVPAAVSAGLSGIGVWAPDITGLVELDSDTDDGGLDEELWVRWMQFGALTPVMRIHLGFKGKHGTGVGVWTSPTTTGLFRDYALLHQRLRPYLARHAAAASATGLPVIRSLILDFPDDPVCWQLSDQYLLGDALLVAPVTERGARERTLYVPEGGWVDHWTGRRHEGPAWVTVPAPLEQIPLLVRAGHEDPLT